MNHSEGDITPLDNSLPKIKGSLKKTLKMKFLAFMPEGSHRDILKHIMKYGIELKILLEEIFLLEQFMMINKYQLKKIIQIWNRNRFP